MKISIWSDFVCPFCFIGESHLNQALEQFKHAEQVQIEYKSFVLSPGTQDVPGQNYYETFAQMKGISTAEAKAMLQQVVEMGRRAGFDINYDLAKHAGTDDAHRVLQYAKELGKDAAFFSRFYKAFFSEGEVLSDHETIVRLAGEVGLDAARVREILESGAYAQNVQEDIAQSQTIGVASVPFFVLNHQYSISGAQPVAEFLRVLEQVWKEEQAGA